VRGRFLFCTMPQQSKTQHGLRTVLAIFPVMRKQATLPLPPTPTPTLTPTLTLTLTLTLTRAPSPMVSSQIPSATLVVVASDAAALPADIQKDLQASWVTFKGVAPRQALLAEALRSEAFI
jgi:hypothetical protein